VKARLITRCGCERYVNIPYPPPPEFVLPLRPQVPNNGLVRRWMDSGPSEYEPSASGPEVRRFRLSAESARAACKWDVGEVWYDEVVDSDPPGFNADERTYNNKEER
jgi:hypothetical protein